MGCTYFLPMMQRSLRAGPAAWLPLLCLLAGCGLTPEVAQALDAQNEKIRVLSSQVESLNRQLADSVTLISCPQDVRSMFADIRTECSKAGVCGTAQIKAADSQLDPSRRYKFFSYIRDKFVHEVVYLSPEQKTIASDLRRERLAKLAGLALLRNSRILVIASDHRSVLDAQTRAKVVTDFLLALQVPEGVIDVWPYAYSMMKADIAGLRSSDTPQFGEAGLLYGVWVFRVDC